jgi:hypothetical protein
VAWSHLRTKAAARQVHALVDIHCNGNALLNLDIQSRRRQLTTFNLLNWAASPGPPLKAPYERDVIPTRKSGINLEAEEMIAWITYSTRPQNVLICCTTERALYYVLILGKARVLRQAVETLSLLDWEMCSDGSLTHPAMFSRAAGLPQKARP